MAADEFDHAEMTALVMDQKYQEQRFEKAQKMIDLWGPRLKLAEERNRPELVAEARRQLEEALKERAGARHCLERIQMDKSMLRHEVNRPEGVNEARNEALLESFKTIGVDPEAVQINDVAKEQSADDALAALKARMQSENDG